MRRFLRILLRVALVIVALLAVAGTGGYFWWKSKTRVEAIPAALPELAPEERIARLRVPGDDGLPDLVLGERRGKTVYLVLESKESMEAREGRAMSLALDRWRYPDGVEGYSIGEAEGLGLLKWKIDDLVSRMRTDARLPLYMDYEGAILRGFGLPKGHTGLVVLSPDGKVLLRHSGAMTDAEIEALRGVLGASEPPAPPAAPEFAVGPLSTRECAGKACAIVFLGRKVASRRDIPFVKDGYEGKPEQAGTLFEDPTLRLMTLLVDQDLVAAGGGARGVFVGELGTAKPAPGWTVTPDDARARAAFGVAAGETAIVVVDEAGRLALFERGRVPLWKLAPLRVLLKLPPESS